METDGRDLKDPFTRAAPEPGGPAPLLKSSSGCLFAYPTRSRCTVMGLSLLARGRRWFPGQGAGVPHGPLCYSREIFPCPKKAAENRNPKRSQGPLFCIPE